MLDNVKREDCARLDGNMVDLGLFSLEFVDSLFELVVNILCSPNPSASKSGV